ncbi:MAG: glycosyltransferase [Saprospiraceae bacterium]
MLSEGFKASYLMNEISNNPLLISTVICTYNRANILPLCLEHIEKQDCNRELFEIIIVNNNSSDETEVIAQDWVKKSKKNLNIRYTFEGKQGLSAARNKGIKEAKGLYVNFIDDDALLPPNFLSTLVKCIHNHTGIAGFGGKIIPKYFGTEPKWMSVFTEGLVSKHNLGERPMVYEKIGIYPTGCNMTYKRSIVQEVGTFDEALLRRCDDKYIAYEIKKKGYQILYVPQLWLEHYIDEERITVRLDTICKDTGFHERIRLRQKSGFIKMLKLLEYLFKLGASILIFFYYVLSNQYTKGIMVVKMRWWFLIGFVQ